MADIDTFPALQDPLLNHLGYQLRRASAVMMADLAATLAETGLKPTEATILLVIRANPGSIQSDVGRLLGIKRANMVPLVASLVEAGLIERSRMDGRSQALHLTPAGEALSERVGKLIDAHEERFQGSLTSKGQRETLLKALRSIRE